MYSTYNTYSQLPKMYSKKKAVRGGVSITFWTFSVERKRMKSSFVSREGEGAGVLGKGTDAERAWTICGKKKKKKGLLRELMRGVVVVAS